MSRWDAIRAKKVGQPVASRPSEPPECPYCHRIMTWREKNEQGCCNDCYAPQGTLF